MVVLLFVALIAGGLLFAFCVPVAFDGGECFNGWVLWFGVAGAFVGLIVFLVGLVGMNFLILQAGWTVH